MNLLKDIYYQKAYIELYLKENETIFEFHYKDANYFFYNISIKRPINKIGNTITDTVFYDLETAYGYGGIISNTSDDKFLKKAFTAYKKECLAQNIIAEFTRVHPFNESFENLSSFCDLYVFDRETIAVNTVLAKEQRWENYPSKIRTILRKCNKELSFEQSTDLTSFMKLYEETMSKNKANSFYYFEKSYFEKLLALKNVDLYVVKLNDTIIAASFFLFGNSLAHYHLSANDYNYRKYNANYFILDSIFDIAHDKKKSFFHLGGGRTADENDSLLKFKRKFSLVTKKFYLGGMVFHKEKYQEYIRLWEKQTDKKINYFLKYRLDLHE